jgi:hypothetical protein
MIAGLAPTSLADLPGVLDHVPANAPMIIAMRNIEATTTGMTRFIESLSIPMPEGEENPIALSKKMLGTAGLDSKGGMALAFVPGADGKIVVEPKDGNEPTVVAILPVSDFAAFVKAMGGDKAEGIASIKLGEEGAFAKNLGGGYAAMAHTSELLEKFEGKAGMNAEHAKALGRNGGDICDGSDLIIIANIPQMQEQLKQASKQMAEQAEQMAALAGEQGEGLKRNSKIGQMVLDNFTRDASVGVLGLTFGEKGVSIDLGAQFKEGSELGQFFVASGKSTSMLSKLPNLPFYFAGAVDISAPGINQIIKNLSAMQLEGLKDSEKTAAQGNILQMLAGKNKVDGQAFVIGSSPAALMGGGLFVNTVQYTAAPDGKALLTATAEAMKTMNGVKSGPVTTNSTYKPEAAEIAGVKVDSWTMNMEFDPNDPVAAQGQMMMGMLMGQGGLAGMSAAVDSGLVTVMSQNTPLMTSAIEAAKSGKNTLGDDALLKDAASHLPADRTMEVYVGVKALMDAGVGAMAMFGGGPEIKVPAQLSPIAIGGTMNHGGVDLRFFVPSDVIKGIADVVKQVKAGEEEEVDDKAADKKPAGDNKPPRF